MRWGGTSSYGAHTETAVSSPALTWYLARGLSLRAACERASVHAAAVLRGINPLEQQIRLE